MASADVFQQPSMPTPTFEPIDVEPLQKWPAETTTPSLVVDLASVEEPEKITFDPAQHLNFVPPVKCHTMKELGLEDVGISPIAVSEPFQLFSEDAIKQMRNEILSKSVMDNFQYSSNLASCQLRGFAAQHAPFVYDAWRSPEVTAIVSKIAGIELVPHVDFEIAHVNISIQSESEKEAAIKAKEEKELRDIDEGVSGCPFEDDEPIVDWHTDSYPFVCVTMLSDCTGMIGGETALRTGSGEVLKVRGPQMGNAVILQGRYIEHQALRALGSTERITMVTSFRPRSPLMKDDTVLTTVRAISDLSELYSQFAEYRLEVLEERIRSHLKEIRDRKRTGRGFNTAATKAFIAEQECHLALTNQEIVEEHKVTKGFTDCDAHLSSADLKRKSKKRARLLNDNQLQQ